MVAAALISGDEASFPLLKNIFEDFLSVNFIAHVEKHCNPLTGHILGVSKKLRENTEERKVTICDRSQGASSIYITVNYYAKVERYQTDKVNRLQG